MKLIFEQSSKAFDITTYKMTLLLIMELNADPGYIGDPNGCQTDI